MNKKFIKIVSILLMVMMVISISVSSFAASGAGVEPSALSGTAPQDKSIQNVGNKIIGVLQTVGVVISVIVLIVLGIKYMMVAQKKKQNIKRQ